MTSPKKLLLLIDADFYFYRSAQISEEEHEYNEELTVVVGDFERGKKIVKQELRRLYERFDKDNVLLTFTDRKNFRKDIDPEYKGNRRKRKPCGYLKLKQWGMETYPSVMKPGLEADDVMGILSTNGSLTNFVLISPDKDMEQIPCRIWNTKKEFDVTPAEGLRKLYEQCLTGDSCDGFGGCKGVGPKRANVILDKVKDQNYWPSVVKTFEEAEMTEQDALRNLRLARILQAEDWDPEKQEPILFKPK